MVQYRMENQVTRRRAGLILAVSAASAFAQPQKPGTTIHFEIDYKTTPERIYHVLLDSKQFNSCTGLAAEIDPKAGGAFRLFDGQIEGRNVELVPDRRIVQAWRPASWPAGVYSIARFELVAGAPGTRIVFDHSGFSEDKQEHLAAGWVDHYWEPLHKYLNA
jgi:activator of HSP90 ATPase